MKKIIQRILLGIFLIIFIPIASISALFFLQIYQDNYETPCNKLPSKSIVEETLKNHQDTIAQIESLDNGTNGTGVGMGGDSFRCPGKADLRISYDTIETRKKIKRLIGKTFFGVPYRMQNT